MKKLRAAFGRTDNNSGSAIISVVVAMLFVVALGVALLFTAYTGYRVKVVERSDSKNFYDASTAMEEVRAGIQKAVNSALTDAYSRVLVNYISYPDPDAEFKARFLVELKATQLFDSSGTGLGIGSSKLAEMPSNPQSAAISVSSGTVDSSTQNQLTVKNVTLKYIDKNGYETNISTDMVIHFPDFYAGSTASAKLGSYAIVANTGLKSEGVGGTVTGDVFAGNGGVSVELGSKLSIAEGDLTCKGDIVTADSNSSSFVFGPGGNDLWSRGIKAGRSSSMNISGNCRVEDDLVLNGKSVVSLSGSYLGFGESKTDAKKSSSIIVNSIDAAAPASLNLSGLTNLTLGGLSFINPEAQTPVVMGQSMSVKSDQLAYLVPAECISVPTGTTLLSAGNPLLYQGTVLQNVTVNADKVLWKIGETERKLSYYTTQFTQMTQNMNSGADPIRMHFVFLKFPSVAKANEYFKDYFTVYPDKIKQYYDIYLKLTTSPATQSVTAGNSFAADNGGVLALEPATAVATGSAQTQFSGFSSPYTKFVDSAKISSTMEFSEGGAVLARVISNAGGAAAYEIGAGETAKLIIAAGNVLVKNSYTGIIISGGTVSVQSNVTSSMLPTEVFTAKNSEGKTMAELGIIRDAVVNEFQGGGQTADRTNAWDPNKLVSYSNWKKY